MPATADRKNKGAFLRIPDHPAAEELHHADMHADPIGEFLARCRFRVGVTAGAQNSDEQLDWNSFARPWIRQLWPFAGKVDEGLLSGAVPRGSPKSGQ